LEEYAQLYPDITRLIVNEINSGGVFHQWKRGIECANGELIWIAESDDFCSLDFLENLISFFDNDAVMLAYTKSIFIQDEKEVWSINDYLSDIDSQLWNQKFVSSAHTLVNEAWGIKNILPNASSAVFRNPKGIKLLDDPSWQTMRICGDWIFYLHVIRGGLVGYTPDATNYYRLHNSNTSVATYTKDIYYQEHQQVAGTISKLYKINTDVLEKQRKSLKNHWDTYMSDRGDDDFLKLYDLTTLANEKSGRKPNIMMVTFALAAGGGETLPIKIANMLSTVGYGVTMVSLQQDHENPAIRSMLSPHIPLLKINYIERIEAIAVSMGVEIIHSHHAWVDLTLVALLQENRTIKMVISTHGMYEMMDAIEFKENFAMLNDRVDKIVYTAEKNMAPFLSIPNGDNLLVKITNALESSIITPVSRSEFGLNKDAFVLCLVSRAIPEKGWKEAIESVREAREISGADIHLLLIGEGEEYTRLKSIASETFIHFCGFKSNIRDYFAMSDLGFLPSRFEGESFPLVIIDCLYANRPVLASNIGEIHTMLNDGDQCAGATFDLDDMKIPVDYVASLIAKFATDKEFYQESLMAIPTIILKYDPDEMIQKYGAIYTEILNTDRL
jgi:glycosyltransferase involved in cell wall biosynthesis